ncbi:BolA family transcriptional regulator [Synechococcus sp. PCC 7336]|uniref:BolA family protein n=1 Tax=Synechococcus sp. PCC 7336 TaxID=195250 RepID=UPI000348C18A|nr:BolA family protein [Synechococcus sp. PCC 7336]
MSVPVSPIATRIARKLESQLQATVVQVENESHLHAGHVGAGEGSHFRVAVVSAAFAGRSTIEQHRLVYEALAEEMRGSIHALALKTYTPQQWEKADGRQG